jgi:hypothetical protein
MTFLEEFEIELRTRKFLREELGFSCQLPQEVADQIIRLYNEVCERREAFGPNGDATTPGFMIPMKTCREKGPR